MKKRKFKKIYALGAIAAVSAAIVPTIVTASCGKTASVDKTKNQDEIEKLQKELDGIKKSKKLIQEQLDNKTKQIVVITKTRDALQKKYDDYKKFATSEHNKALEEFNKKINDEKIKFKNLEKAKLSIEDELATAKNELISLNKSKNKLENTLTEANKKIAELEKQRNLAKSDLANANAQITTLQDQINAKNPKIADLVKKLSDAEGKAAGLASNLKISEDKVKNLTSKLTAANGKVTTLTASNEKLDTGLKAAQARVVQLTNDLAAANSEITKLKNAKTSSTTNLETANRKIATLTTDKEKLATDLATANGKVARLTKNITDEQAKSKQLDIDLKAEQAKTIKNLQTISDLQAELKLSKDNVKDLTPKLAKANQSIQGLTGEKAQLDKELKAEQKEVKRLAAEVATANQSIQDLTGEKDKLTTNLTDEQAKSKQLDIDFKAEQAKTVKNLQTISDLQAELKLSKDNVKDLTPKLAKANQSIQGLTGEKAQLDKELKAEQKEVKRLAAEVATKQKEVKDLTDNLTAKKGEVTTLTNEKADLVVKLAKANQSIQNLTGEKADLVAEVAKANQSIQGLTGEKAQLDKELKAEQKEVKRLATEVAKANQSIQGLTGEKDKLEKTYSALETQLQETKKQLKAAKDLLEIITKTPINQTITLDGLDGEGKINDSLITIDNTKLALKEIDNAHNGKNILTLYPKNGVTLPGGANSMDIVVNVSGLKTAIDEKEFEALKTAINAEATGNSQKFNMPSLKGLEITVTTNSATSSTTNEYKDGDVLNISFKPMKNFAWGWGIPKLMKEVKSFTVTIHGDRNSVIKDIHIIDPTSSIKISGEYEYNGVLESKNMPIAPEGTTLSMAYGSIDGKNHYYRNGDIIKFTYTAKKGYRISGQSSFTYTVHTLIYTEQYRFITRSVVNGGEATGLRELRGLMVGDKTLVYKKGPYNINRFSKADAKRDGGSITVDFTGQGTGSNGAWASTFKGGSIHINTYNFNGTFVGLGLVTAYVNPNTKTIDFVSLHDRNVYLANGSTTFNVPTIHHTTQKVVCSNNKTTKTLVAGDTVTVIYTPDRGYSITGADTNGTKTVTFFIK